MEVSTISAGEMIQLYSSFIYLTTDGLNCKTTLKKSTPEATKIRHNCDFKYSRKVFGIDNIVWNSCLCRFQHSNFNEIMILSKHYEKGLLPMEGTILDQPNALIEKLELIDHLKNLHKQEQHKEMETKQNGNSRHRPQTQSRKPKTRV